MPTRQITREDIEAAAERCGGVVEAMARLLCVHWRALRDRIAQEHLDMTRYRSHGGPRIWSECRTEDQRQELLAATLQATGGNRTEAARLLQMARGYLHQVIAKYARLAEMESATSVSTTDTGSSVSTVRPTVSPALTYWLPGPNFHRVDTVEATDANLMTFQIALPKQVKDWLERKALDRKQSSGGRFAVSPVIVEILQAQMREEQGQ